MSERKANEVRTYCSMCLSLHPVIAEVEHGIFTRVKADPDHPYSGALCEKGLAGPELVYHPDRLNYPLKRTKPKSERDGGWVRISWDEALDTIVKRLSEIRDKYGPESVTTFISATTGAFIDDFFWQLRFANSFGTPNKADMGVTVCEFGRDTLSALTFGLSFESEGGFATCLQMFPEYENTACMMLWGYNARHTEMEPYRRIGVAKRRGAKLIAVDPRVTEVAEMADLHMQVRPGTDACLAMSMINVMLTKELYDKEFVRDWTNGPFLVRTDTSDLLTEKDLYPTGSPKKYIVWNEVTKSPKSYDPATVSYESPDVIPTLRGVYKITLANGKRVECKTVLQLLAERAAKYEPKKAEELTWVPADDIVQAAIWMSSLKPSCFTTFTGLEQNTNHAQTMRAVHVMYALTGNFDSPGGSVRYPFPPAAANYYEGGDLLPPEQYEKMIMRTERPLGASLRGLVSHFDIYEAILTGKPYPIRAGLGFGANILCLGCDGGSKGREALQKLDFLCWQELFMTPTAELADIVLPAASVWEAPDVTVYSEMVGFPHMLGDYIQYREPVVPPLYERWPDLKIFCELAKRFGFGDKFFNGDWEACLNYKIAPSGYTLEQLRNSPGGIYLGRVVPRYRKHAEWDPQTNHYHGVMTPTRKIEIFSTQFKKHGYDPLPDFIEPMVSPISQLKLAEKYPLILIDARTIYMTQSQFAGLPSIRRKIPNAFVEIHPDTAEEYGIKDGDMVYIETKNGKIKQQAKVTDKILPRVVCATFGWWQGCPQLGIPQPDPFGPEGSNYSVLITSEFIDPISGSYPLNGFLCSIKKAE